MRACDRPRSVRRVRTETSALIASRSTDSGRLRSVPMVSCAARFKIETLTCDGITFSATLNDAHNVSASQMDYRAPYQCETAARARAGYRTDAVRRRKTQVPGRFPT